MKPPPRTRNKPGPVVGAGETLEESGKLSHNWKRSERRKLLKALTCLAKTTGGLKDIDYTALKGQVSTRSVPQIQFYVEGLKDRVISSACSCLDNKHQTRKPIEVWTRLASTVTGNHTASICQAFSQMLKVASTEPCNLKNGVPAQVRKLGDRNMYGSAPQRPVPVLPSPGQGEGPGTNTALPNAVKMKTPAPTKGGRANRGPVSSNVVKPPTSEKPCSNSAAKVKTVKSRVMQQTSSSSATSLTPLPSAAPSSAQSSASATSNQPVEPATAPTPAPPPRSGCTQKPAPTLSPRTRSVNSSVNFEKLYCYISSVNQPEDQCALSTMESAIILDLLMSLPEELSLLHCNKLKKHLIQVHQSLSAPAGSEPGRDVFKELRDGLFGQAGGQDTAGGQQDAAPTSESSRVTDSEKTDAADSQSSGTSNTSTQPGQARGTGLPLLNPFLVPLHLLMRK